ncbi:MAG: 5-(carboxyamino)imidazole ribonucleotide synthase [Alphaproteobacteria bacterium]|nr:5-(carboxyamino)imidazole ribonucleotide synthase [Alphaproteobacteria bacterium]
MSHPKALSAPVHPGGTIGILGGGQLGRMLAMAAARLGLKVHVFSDEDDVPAFQVCHHRTVERYNDIAALQDFARHCDVVTFEFENVPAAAIAALAPLVPTYPNARALAVTQDRLHEKTFVREQGIATAPFANVTSEAGAVAALKETGTPSILKTRRFGYDGKGQAKVTSAEEAKAALARFDAPCLMEGFVPFSFEASVVAARGLDGSFAAYDPPENFHADHILRRSTVPGRLTKAQSEDAKAIAKKLMEALDYVGVMATELFVARDGSLLVNELAPRVHNSGHWTIEACAVSQFEQHIRAVAGWPLGNPARHSDAVMENIIGAEAEDWLAYARRAGGLHLYGKAEARAGRKMGHFTSLSPRTG